MHGGKEEGHVALGDKRLMRPRLGCADDSVMIMPFMYYP